MNPTSAVGLLSLRVQVLTNTQGLQQNLKGGPTEGGL